MARTRHAARGQIDANGRSVRVEVPLGDAENFWRVSAVFVEHYGQLALAELRIFPGEALQAPDQPRIGEWSGDTTVLTRMPPGGLTRRAVQTDLSFRALVKQLQATLAAEVERSRPRTLARIKAMEEAGTRPGRAGRPDLYYALWASHYVKELERGSASPVADMAARAGFDKPQQLADLLHEARRRTLLTRAGRGKAGGELTEKAKALLQADEAERNRRRR